MRMKGKIGTSRYQRRIRCKQRTEGLHSQPCLDANPANRATGHPSPVPCQQGIFLFFFVFFGGKSFFFKKNVSLAVSFSRYTRTLGILSLELRCWRVWRWFTLAPHTIIHTNMNTFVYIYIYCLCVFLSIYESCLPKSLFLLDTGVFRCPTTSCRPCHPTFLPGFHRFS